MPFNTKFTPSQYQDRDQYNEHVLNERYATVKALRESYSHIYQELSNLRNNLQDYKAEQDNQPELATSEADRIRYNNEVENRYLALKSIQLNTSYPDEYGHTVRPFSENKAAEQIRLHCHYMISGSHHFKQYHLAKTSCIELNQDTVGEKVKEYNSNAANMKTGNLHVTGFSITPATRAFNETTSGGVANVLGNTGIFTTSAAHGLVLGDQLFCYICTDDTVSSTTETTYKNKAFYVNSIPSTTTFTVSETLGGSTVADSTANTAAASGQSTKQAFSFFRRGDDEKVVLTMVAAHGLSVGDSVHLSGFKAAAGYDIFNGLTTTAVATTSGVTVSFNHDVFGLHQGTAWAIATHAGEIDVGYEVFFPYKKIYLNKLDATNSSAVYGKDSSSQTFTYSDNYIEKGLDTVEGHIYVLTKGNTGSNAELDGRQSASVLGRNVQNLENMIEIIANNANATEQALNRIVQIAELVGVEINHA